MTPQVEYRKRDFKSYLKMTEVTDIYYPVKVGRSDVNAESVKISVGDVAIVYSDRNLEAEKDLEDDVLAFNEMETVEEDGP